MNTTVEETKEMIVAWTQEFNFIPDKPYYNRFEEVFTLGDHNSDTIQEFVNHLLADDKATDVTTQIVTTKVIKQGLVVHK